MGSLILLRSLGGISRLIGSLPKIVILESFSSQVGNSLKVRFDPRNGLSDI